MNCRECNRECTTTIDGKCWRCEIGHYRREASQKWKAGSWMAWPDFCAKALWTWIDG